MNTVTSCVYSRLDVNVNKIRSSLEFQQFHVSFLTIHERLLLELILDVLRGKLSTNAMGGKLII